MLSITCLFMQEHEKGISDLENQQISPLVWICMSARNRSEVTIVDANSPGDVLDSFVVSQSNILCIASVPGLLLHPFEIRSLGVKA